MRPWPARLSPTWNLNGGRTTFKAICTGPISKNWSGLFWTRLSLNKEKENTHANDHSALRTGALHPATPPEPHRSPVRAARQSCRCRRHHSAHPHRRAGEWKEEDHNSGKTETG